MWRGKYKILHCVGHYLPYSPSHQPSTHHHPTSTYLHPALDICSFAHHVGTLRLQQPVLWTSPTRASIRRPTRRLRQRSVLATESAIWWPRLQPASATATGLLRPERLQQPGWIRLCTLRPAWRLWRTTSATIWLRLRQPGPIHIRRPSKRRWLQSRSGATLLRTGLHFTTAELFATTSTNHERPQQPIWLSTRPKRSE